MICLCGMLLAQPLSGLYLITGSSDFTNQRFASLQEAFDSLRNRGAQGAVTIRLPGGSAWSPVNEPSTIRLPGYTCNNCIVRVELDTAVTIAKSPTNAQSERFVLRFSGAIRNFTLDGMGKCTLHTQTVAFGTGVVGFVSEPGNDLLLRNVRLEGLHLRGSGRGTTEIGVFVGRDAALSGTNAVLPPPSSVDTLMLRRLRIQAISNGIYVASVRGVIQNLFIEEDTVGTPISNPNMLDEQSWGANLGASGIRVGGGYDVYIRRCVVRNAVRNDNQYVLLSGIRTDSCERVRILQNLVHGIRYVGTEGYANHGMLIQVPTTYNLPDGDHIIANNMIADIYGDADDDPAFANSFLRGAYYPSGIAINSFDPVSDARVKIWHNSIHLFGQNPSSYPTGGSACITIRPRVSGGVIIEGNILQNTLRCGTASDKKAYGIALFHNGTTSFTIGTNAYYVASGAAGGNFAGLTYQTDRSWSAWQGLGYEAAGKWLSAAVPFVSNIDLHLVGLPADIVGSGPLPLRVMDDFDGDIRPLGGTAPDLGADEVDESTTFFSQPLSQVLIYPNPTGGEVFLRLPSAARLRLYDLSGALLYEAEHVEREGRLRLPVSEGLYLLHIEGRGWQTSSRLLVKP